VNAGLVVNSGIIAEA